MVSFGNLNKVQLFVEPLKLEALDISFNKIGKALYHQLI
jgi:hypothetical protein